MATYKTIQGDTFDGIAFKLWGDEKYMKDLIQANLDYADILIFSPNVELTIPEIEEESDPLPFWREGE